MTVSAKKLINRANPQLANESAAPTLPSATLKAFLGAFGRLGYDTTTLLAATGVAASQLEDPDARVPCPAMPTLICEAMKVRPLKNAGARVAAETPIGTFQLLDYLIVTCDTVAEGMRQLARFLHIAEAPFHLEIHDEQDPIRLIYPDIHDKFMAEFEVSLPIFHLRRETDSRLTAEYASFAHTPDDLPEMERLLGCSVSANASWTGLALSRSAWDLPLRRRDPALQGLLQRNADQISARMPKRDDVVGDLRRMLTSRIAQGETEIEALARLLATSVRSLQRRLSAAGTTYQELLDSTRREVADKYLADRGLSISVVGYLLGYSEPAAFIRAFKRWHDMTPQEFRRRQGAIRA